MPANIVNIKLRELSFFAQGVTLQKNTKKHNIIYFVCRAEVSIIITN